MRISDWSSDVCSSDLLFGDINAFRAQYASVAGSITDLRQRLSGFCKRTLRNEVTEYIRYTERRTITRPFTPSDDEHALYEAVSGFLQRPDSYALPQRQRHLTARSEEHTSELQSLMRISYAVFCLKKKKKPK